MRAWRESERPDIEYTGVDVADDIDAIEKRRARRGLPAKAHRKRNRESKRYPTGAYHAAWIAMAIFLGLLIGLAFYVGWGSRQMTDQPLYSEVSFTTNRNVHWYHTMNAGVFLVCGIGVLLLFSLLNFLWPNKGTKGKMSPEKNLKQEIPDHSFFNHVQVYVVGGSLAVFWFLTLSVLGVTDLSALLFAPLLVFASESHFGLSEYLSHLVDKRRTRDRAIARVAWADFVTRATNLGISTAVDDDVISKSISDLLFQAEDALDAAEDDVLDNPGDKGLKAKYDKADLYYKNILLLDHCWPVIKNNYPVGFRQQDQTKKVFGDWDAGDAGARTRITLSVFLIGMFCRFAIWGIAATATFYAWTDLNKTQCAAVIMMMVFDLFFYLYHSFCLLRSIAYEPVGYFRGHMVAMLLVILTSISMGVTFSLALHKEADLPA